MSNRPHKIIVIDDEEHCKFIYETIFDDEIEDDEMVFAFYLSGEDFLKSHYMNNLDKVYAILCDISMPGISGLDIFKIVREKSNEVSFYIVSAHIDSAVHVKAQALNASGYILKPIDFEIIRKQVLNK